MSDPRKTIYLDEAIRIVSGYNGTPMIVEQLKQLPPEERKTGKWLEKEVIHANEAKKAIEEWQSCKCSVCGRYDTRPYMYYFSEPRFCSWCGAKNGRSEDEQT